MGLAFGYFNGFWWFFCFKNSGFVRQPPMPIILQRKNGKNGMLPFYRKNMTPTLPQNL
jgi:hypothetical protein